MTLFGVMKAESPHFNELPSRRVVTLRPSCNEAINKRRYDKGCYDYCNARSDPMRRCPNDKNWKKSSSVSPETPVTACS